MESKQVIKALAALAQDTRLTIFRALIQCGPQGLSVGRIAEQVDIAPATLSFHLKELSISGLLSSRQDGRYVIYSANFAAMNDLIGFLTENCCGGNSCTSVTACASAEDTR
jgi:DNA-binding transcriptional ArsR family regulator